jgi:hypothetical protein
LISEFFHRRKTIRSDPPRPARSSADGERFRFGGVTQDPPIGRTLNVLAQIDRPLSMVHVPTDRMPARHAIMPIQARAANPAPA